MNSHRALGDFAFKSSGVICKPYFATREIKSDDVCVCLASDGLWDVMDEEVDHFCDVMDEEVDKIA